MRTASAPERRHHRRQHDDHFYAVTVDFLEHVPRSDLLLQPRAMQQTRANRAKRV
jgi:hypothetical protein